MVGKVSRREGTLKFLKNLKFSGKSTKRTDRNVLIFRGKRASDSMPINLQNAVFYINGNLFLPDLCALSAWGWIVRYDYIYHRTCHPLDGNLNDK